MGDGAVLARRVHCLEDHQERMAVGGIEQLLPLAQTGDVFPKLLLVILLGAIDWLDLGGPVVELDLFVFGRPEFLTVDFHALSTGGILAHPGVLARQLPDAGHGFAEGGRTARLDRAARSRTRTGPGARGGVGLWRVPHRPACAGWRAAAYHIPHHSRARDRRPRRGAGRGRDISESGPACGHPVAGTYLRGLS